MKRRGGIVINDVSGRCRSVMDGVNIKSRTGPENYIVHPMPWMMAIPLHISSMFGIDNIKSISEDVQNCRGVPRDL